MSGGIWSLAAHGIWSLAANLQVTKQTKKLMKDNLKRDRSEDGQSSVAHKVNIHMNWFIFSGCFSLNSEVICL